jgi:hypothetical protein
MTTTTPASIRVHAGDPASPPRPRRERGSVSVEVAILAPALAALIVLAVVIGRGSLAYNHVAAAAHDAARAASISRTEQAAVAQATAVAQAMLDDQDCAEVDITVDAAQLNLPVGEPAMVNVTVVCVLEFSDVGLSLTRTLEARFYSPVDVWRGRGPP